MEIQKPEIPHLGTHKIPEVGLVRKMKIKATTTMLRRKHYNKVSENCTQM